MYSKPVPWSIHIMDIRAGLHQPPLGPHGIPPLEGDPQVPGLANTMHSKPVPWRHRSWISHGISSGSEGEDPRDPWIQTSDLEMKDLPDRWIGGPRGEGPLGPLLISAWRPCLFGCSPLPARGYRGTGLWYPDPEDTTTWHLRQVRR